MYGYALTQKIERQLASLLHQQEKAIRDGGTWDKARWSEICDKVAELKERFDLPNGYTHPDDPFAEECDLVWKPIVQSIYALRPMPSLFDLTNTETMSTPSQPNQSGAWAH